MTSIIRETTQASTTQASRFFLPCNPNQPENRLFPPQQISPDKHVHATKKILSPSYNPPTNSSSHAIHLPHRPIPNKTTRRPRRKRLARLPCPPQLPEEMVTTRPSSQHLLHLPVPLQRLRHLHTPRKRKLFLKLLVS